jgi:uncharacterized protein
MSDATTPVASPCIGVCAMNESTGFCHGCYRTIEEIRDWWDMSDAKKQAVVDELAARETGSLSFD